jgi:hypothetical protein
MGMKTSASQHWWKGRRDTSNTLTDFQSCCSLHCHLHVAAECKCFLGSRTMRSGTPPAKFLCHIRITPFSILVLPNHKTHICQLPKATLRILKGVEAIVWSIRAAVLAVMATSGWEANDLGDGSEEGAAMLCNSSPQSIHSSLHMLAESFTYSMATVWV